MPYANLTEMICIDEDTKNEIYTFKSDYWGAKNILYHEHEEIVLEPSTTKSNAFARKINAPQKIRHFVRQLVSGYVTVTENLTRRHMCCGNHCPRCGYPNELVNHVIFEFPPYKLWLSLRNHRVWIFSQQ